MKNLLNYVYAEAAFINLIDDLSPREIAAYKAVYPETALFGYHLTDLFKNNKQAVHANNHSNYHQNLHLYHKAHSILEHLNGNHNEAEHHANLSALHGRAANHFGKAAKGFTSGMGFARTRFKKGAAINNEINQMHQTYNIPKSSVTQKSSSPKVSPHKQNLIPQHYLNRKASAKPSNPASKPSTTNPPNFGFKPATPSPKAPLKPAAKPKTPRVFNWQKPNRKKATYKKTAKVPNIKAKTIKYRAPKSVKSFKKTP